MQSTEPAGKFVVAREPARGAGSATDRLRVVVQNMTCPKCNAAMQTVTVGGYEVDRCTGCGGLWFDLREHEHVAESSADVARLDTGDASKGAAQNQLRDIQCPACHVKMLKLSVPDQLHIKYESCPVCYGAFFDAGEFKDYASRTLIEQVGNFFRGFRRRPTAP